jgi:hypothetical protein
MEYPSLQWMSDIHYKCEYGYFMLKEHNRWIFLPFEYEFDADLLLSIINTLKNLNENTSNEL